MDFKALSCPQCGGILPKQASWRMVTCPFCGSMVTHSKSVVEAAPFHAAKVRLLAGKLAQAHDAGARVLRWQGQNLRLLNKLGTGEQAEVYLAERLGLLPERLTLKLAHRHIQPGVLAVEAVTLSRLEESQLPGAAYFTQHLPQLVNCGVTDDEPGHERDVLLLRHPSGYWGSLDKVLAHAPGGISPRHAVWMWRRVLEVLGFVHDNGWTHGDLALEHWLVHPRDHGILIIGWAKARQVADAAAIARDLMQTAWTVRALLSGGDGRPGFNDKIPIPLAELLQQCSEDVDWCIRQGARGLDRALVAAARQAFGPPRFISFDPTAANRE